MTKDITRRNFLARSALLGCSAAASPLLTPVTFAAAPWDTRLVVIILRGGMDGLDVVQPYGDPDYARLRKTLQGGPDKGAFDLDGFYALNPALAPLMPLWRKEDLGFMHAVSTPYRNKRSHFDGQDLLEAGTVSLSGARDGWLNRALQHVSGVENRTAFALGMGDLKLLDGEAPVSDWSPDAQLVMTPQALRLTELMMEQDPLFHAALSEAVFLSEFGEGEGLDEMDETDLAAMQMSAPRRKRGKFHVKLAEYAAQRLKEDTRVASFSINGWDTHTHQSRGLRLALNRLSETILTLQSGLGGTIWQKTAIIAMTEFGRTARENGSGGTDHGTGGALVLAGGAINGGKVHGSWPGLSEDALFQRRDLMPTADVRMAAAWMLQGIMGLNRSALETDVFPDLDMGQNPRLLL